MKGSLTCGRPNKGFKSAEGKVEKNEHPWQLKLSIALTVAVARGLDHVLQFLPARLPHLAVANQTEGNPGRCLQILSQDPRVDWNTRNTAGDTPAMVAIASGKFSQLEGSAGKCRHSLQHSGHPTASSLSTEGNVWAAAGRERRLRGTEWKYSRLSSLFPSVQQEEAGISVCSGTFRLRGLLSQAGDLSHL